MTIRELEGLVRSLFTQLLSALTSIPPAGWRFIEIGILERTEGLDLLVGGQLIAVPAPAERTDERD